MIISGTTIHQMRIETAPLSVPDQVITIADANTLRTVSFDGSRFITGDQNGNIYVSADGASWDGEGSTGTKPLMKPLVFDGTYYYGITYTTTSYANVPGYTNTGNLRYSTDLATWTATTNGNSVIAANAFATIAYNGGTGNAQYQAVALNPLFSYSGNIVTQIAGANGAQTGWQAGIQGATGMGGPRLNLFGANRWVIFVDDISGGSSSGLTYCTTAYSFPVANANTNISDNLNIYEVYRSVPFQGYYASVAYGNGIFMATPMMASGGYTANAVLTSTDAVTWTVSNVASWPTNVNATTSLVYSNNTQTWAMLVRQEDAGLFNGIWVSDNNGNTWSNIAPTEGNNQWWNLAYGDGKFVAVGANGNVCIRNGY